MPSSVKGGKKSYQNGFDQKSKEYFGLLKQLMFLILNYLRETFNFYFKFLSI